MKLLNNERIEVQKRIKVIPKVVKRDKINFLKY